MLDSGVDRFREVVDPAQLPAVVNVAVDALWDVFVTAAVIAAAGFVAALGIRWVRIEEDKGAKKDDEKQRVEESDG